MGSWFFPLSTDNANKATKENKCETGNFERKTINAFQGWELPVFNFFLEQLKLLYESQLPLLSNFGAGPLRLELEILQFLTIPHLAPVAIRLTN